MTAAASGKRANANLNTNVTQRLKQKRNDKRQSTSRYILIACTGSVIAIIVSILLRQTNSNTIPSSPLSLGHTKVRCLDSYPHTGQCSPPKSCGRVMRDELVTEEEVDALRRMAEKGMAFGRGSGGPTIFDVATGAASRGEQFVNAYQMMENKWKQTKKRLEKNLDTMSAEERAVTINATSSIIFTPSEIELYRSLTSRIRSLISSEFGAEGLYLTSPSFFSRLTSAPAKTRHDEYWHEHVDKKQYGSFIYTALIYLSDHGSDFDGGEFVFVDDEDDEQGIDQKGSNDMKRHIVAKPKKGRVMAFTSGRENVHMVTPVTRGIRHALTIAFTCDQTKSVEQSLMQQATTMAEWQRQWEKQLQIEKIPQTDEDKTSDA